MSIGPEFEHDHERSPVDLGERPYPGSDAALDAGCICPVLDNGHGNAGLARDRRGGWIIIVGCPMHCPIGGVTGEGT